MQQKMLGALALMYALAPPRGSASPDPDPVVAIVDQIHRHNQALQAATHAVDAVEHAQLAAGYPPEPSAALNLFGSPLETRNGPQRANFLISQPIPWPGVLASQERLAASRTEVQHQQRQLKRLDLTFQAKSLIYRAVELAEKKEQQQKMRSALHQFSQVVLSQLKMGTASATAVSRVNLDLARLSQAVRKIQGEQIAVSEQLKLLAGGNGDILALLPTSYHPRWGQLAPFDAAAVDVRAHPLILLAQASLQHAQAEVDQADLERLPRLATSLSWFEIGPPKQGMGGSGEGKNAWAVGASVSVPLWTPKYDSQTSARLTQRAMKAAELRHQTLELQAQIRQTVEDYQACSEILAIITADMVPQAIQTLRSDQETYAQGQVPFHQVLQSFGQVIELADQQLESQRRQATLKARLEQLLAKPL